VEGAPSVSFQCWWAAGQPWAGYRGRRQRSRQVGEGQKSKTRYNVVVSFQGRPKADDFECRRFRDSQLFGIFVLVVAAGQQIGLLVYTAFNTVHLSSSDSLCQKERWD
jgi:hypothetical protein